MSAWDGDSHSSGSRAEHEPSEERGQAAWAASGGTGSGPEPAAHREPAADPEPVTPPPWASAQTQTFSASPYTPPPPPDPASFPPPGPEPAPQPGVTPAPFPVPPPPPPPPSSPRGRRLLVILTAAAVLGAGVGTGVWFLVRDGSDRPATVANPATSPATSSATSPGEGTATTPSVSTLASPSPSSSSSPSLSASPGSGYRRAEDPVGYTLFVPEDWTRRQKQGEKAPVVFYESPEDGRSLQIFALSEDTPADSLDLAENAPGYGFSRQPGFQALSRDSAADWSELSYRYDDKDLGPRQVIDHRFETPDGTLYAMRASGPEDLAPELVRKPLSLALESFATR